MGWTTMRSRGRSRLEILRELFRNSNATFTDTVLDHSIQGGTVYMLVERRPLPGAAFEPSHTYVNDPDGAFRWIAVFLTRRARDEYDFGYKDMEESMGPCEAHCPKRIIDRASPLRNTTPGENNFALNWRERCEQNRVLQAAARAMRPTEGAVDPPQSPAQIYGRLRRPGFYGALSPEARPFLSCAAIPGRRLLSRHQFKRRRLHRPPRRGFSAQHSRSAPAISLTFSPACKLSPAIARAFYFWRLPMADYYTQLVVQQTIPSALISPFEQLLLGEMLEHEQTDDEMYFFASEQVCDFLTVLRSELQEALAATSQPSRLRTFAEKPLAASNPDASNPGDYDYFDLDLSACELRQRRLSHHPAGHRPARRKPSCPI